MAAGDVVNTAARLQSAAPVNGILVDETTYRATRDVIHYDEADPVRDAAIASVLASEVVAPAAPRAAGVRREVLFSACKATEVAWESGGHGDFTRTAIPLLTTGVGSVSNRDFVRQVVEQFGPNRRQTPEFHGEEVLGGRILLGTASASAVAGDGAGTVGTGAVTPVGPGTRTDDAKSFQPAGNVPLPALLVCPCRPSSSSKEMSPPTGTRALMVSPAPLMRAISGVP